MLSLRFGLFLLSLGMILNGCGGAKPTTPPTTRLRSAPELPGPTTDLTITSPANPILTNSSALTIRGTCTSSAQVSITGAASLTTICEDNKFSFILSTTADGIFSYSLSQIIDGVPSSSVPFQWTSDTTAPGAITLTSPANSSFHSSGSSLSIEGPCEVGATVILSGSTNQTLSCGAGTFVFPINRSSDGIYNFSISQRDSAGNSSSPIALIWSRDTIAPSGPTIVLPGANPYASADTNFNLSGACENNATVQISGDLVDSVNCETGSYSFAISATIDGTYDYSLSQTDLAGNTSSALSFQWIKSTVTPATPLITAPANPHISNGNSVSLTGTCTSGNTVHLSGDEVATTICSSGSFTFNIGKTTDSDYSFLIHQTNSIGSDSAATSFLWTRDTVSPSSLVISSPSENPFRSNSSNLNLNGTCESGATVYLSGDSINSTSCADGTFNFSTTKSSDGTYNFSLQQADRAGNLSTSTSQTWSRDTSTPLAPTITNLASPYISNTTSMTLSGSCENAATVNLSGDSTQSMICAASAYSFTVFQAVDGTYNFSIAQTDLSNNTSSAVGFVWTKDTIAPSGPLIVSPATSPYYSSGSALVINGSCESNALVSLAGDSAQSANCSSGAFSFTYNQTIDGTYNFSIIQTDAAANASNPTSLQWVRDSSAPPTPVISSPSTSPFYSNQSNLTVGGSCTTGNTVEISGDATEATACVGGTFSFNVNKVLDGNYTFSILQKSASQVPSGTTTVTWIRDTISPNTLVISTPAASPIYTNSNSLTIVGSCESGSTVNLSGDSAGSTTCASGSFSFAIAKTTGGSFTFVLNQADLAGNVSATILQDWIRDTVSPSTPIVTSPSLNPFGSGDTNLTIAGSCEVGATVQMSGDSNATMSCTALGQFSFTTNKTVDGTYSFNLSQTDRANNTSASNLFQWIRDTSIPFTPILVAPSSNPYRSNQNTLVITVSCDDSLSPSPAVVNLTGDVMASEVLSPANQLSQNCTSSPVSFTVQKATDGAYNFTFDQDNPNASTTSSSATLQWIKDTQPPSAPIITSPATNPFTAPGNLTLSGSCEANATVSLTGSSTQNQTCSVGSTFSFSIIGSVDGTFDYGVSQTDLAGNNSSSAGFQWVRDSGSVPTPTIISPITSPLINNTSAYTVSGTCNNGYTVTLSGDVTANEITNPLNSLTQTCLGGSFSYTISKDTDGTYSFDLKQTFNSVDSGITNRIWTRDTVAPLIAISGSPSSPNIISNASFTFSANEAVTFSCKLDSGSFTSCSSPTNYASISNGSHTFYIIGTDTAGNNSIEQSSTWTQASYNTMALYHLDSSSPTTDSSSFTQSAGFSQNLVATGSPANDSTGKYPSGAASSRSFGSNIYYSTGNTEPLGLGTRTMTVEGFVKISSAISTTGNYYTLISKTGSASPNFGWEVRLRKSTSNRYALDFVGSLDGTTTGSIVSSNNFSLSTNTWYYFAVTWNLGTVRYYLGTTSATARGSKTIGSAGTSVLATTTSALKLGANATSGTGASLWFAGSLDEVRISQTLRTISVPTAAFAAD